MLDDSLILASASPRRVELLQQMGVRFTTIPAQIDETPLTEELATDYVTRMALEKAGKIAQSQPDTIPVLGADTVVLCEEKIFTKPENFDHAKSMLLALSDNRHQVLTAVALVKGTKKAVTVSVSEVWFRTISDAECQAYWRSGEPKDKAGAYAIQGYGAVFVERLEGSFSGIVGLPIAETSKLLQQFNVPIWGSYHHSVEHTNQGA